MKRRSFFNKAAVAAAVVPTVGLIPKDNNITTPLSTTIEQDLQEIRLIGLESADYLRKLCQWVNVRGEYSDYWEPSWCKNRGVNPNKIVKFRYYYDRLDQNTDLSKKFKTYDLETTVCPEYVYIEHYHSVDPIIELQYMFMECIVTELVIKAQQQDFNQIIINRIIVDSNRHINSKEHFNPRYNLKVRAAMIYDLPNPLK